MKRVLALLGIGLAALVVVPAVAVTAATDDHPSPVAARNVDPRDAQVASTTVVTAAVDSLSGAIPTTSGADTAVPLYATCEEAINSPSNTEPCDADELEAFALWGERIGLLYADDLPIDLGVWDPIGDDDWEFNESVVYACLGVLNGEDEYVWLDEQLLRWTDYSASANEKLFDAAMQYVCPDLDYQRRNEWDFHVPAEFVAVPTTTLPASTTAVAAPSTTLPAPTSTRPAPTTALAAALPTTVPGTAVADETTAQINTVDGTTAFTCGDIVSIRGEQVECPESFQVLFNEIVANDPDAFNTYIYDHDLGFFSTQEVTVPETAFVGLLACVTMASQDSYTQYDTDVRGLFPAANPADTQRAWDAAALVLCPFLPQ
jgi:hypothetical protein